MEKRDINAKIISAGKYVVLSAIKGRLLKNLIFDSEMNTTVSLPCGGMGRCGKCKVLFIIGAPKPTSADEAFLTRGEIENGVRLLCRCVLDEDCEISLDYDASDGSDENIRTLTTDENNDELADNCPIAIAIDIGTTTIAAALIKVNDNDVSVIKTVGRINHQRKYGADVISRITAAEDANAFIAMQKSVVEDICEVISILLFAKECETATNEFERSCSVSDSEATNIPLHMPETICIAGNTTMLHILRGYDVSSLGKYPYKADKLDMERLTFAELCAKSSFACNSFGNAVFSKKLMNAPVVILPGISAFVGADIVSGIYETDLISISGRKALFLDLGTNGEMAYFNGRELLVTSTAAGPVFEGGGISCGFPSVTGAICHVSIEKDSGKSEYNIKYETIGDAAPIGLCGTGVLEAVAELARLGIIDSTGLLNEEFFEKGFPIAAENNIYITQADIRNVQLAKAAIRTGMETLLNGDIPDNVYVAGGFGSHIDVKKIFALGLFPDSLKSGGEPVGNTSLKGCIRLAKNILQQGYSAEAVPKSATAALNEITQIAKEIILADMDEFDENYIKALGF